MASQATYYTNVTDDAQLLQGQAEILNLFLAFSDTLAIRSIVELHIPDIIYSHGHPITITEIASKIESSSLNIPCLSRVMRVLTRKKLFTINYNQEGEPLYGLTSTSKWFVRDTDLSFAPMFLTLTHPTTIAPWYEIGHSIKVGGTPFEKAHGETIWEKMSKDPEFNELFNSGMASVSRTMMNAILKGYKEEFSKLEGTLVDVGGGIGEVLAEIVKAHPHIKGINFDLPHVVANAPPYPGVTHVGGDMFEEIPKADTIFVKCVLHDWGDGECIKMLKNCQKAISKKNGKVILVEIVLQSDGKELLDDVKMALDLFMMTLCCGGKERTENEWKKLLNDAGFARYNIIQIPALVSIIEAFPQ